MPAPEGPPFWKSEPDGRLALDESALLQATATPSKLHAVHARQRISAGHLVILLMWVRGDSWRKLRDSRQWESRRRSTTPGGR